ncbi:lysophospholipid acyltransferase family protein [bacterium]|nr:lysophospholipid acyltransferase family protein [candidate division CSSED10-310 bacterium]
MSKIKDLLLLIQWYPVRWLIRCLPHNAIIRTGQLLGLMMFLLKRDKRIAATREYLKTCPEHADRRNIDHIIRTGFMEACTVAMESFCFPAIHRSNINRWMRIHGDSHLNQALARGNGIVIILAHFGANQMVMAALGHRDYRINQIGSRPDDWHRLAGIKPSLTEHIIFRKRLAIERTLPAEFIYIDKSMRPVYQCLERNEIMMLAADGRAGTRFLQTRMCDRTMNVSAGPFRIAAATGASLIPVFPVRDQDGVHDLYIEQPICPGNATDAGDWAHKAAIEYGLRLTDWVRFRPDHYILLMAEAKKRSSIDPVPLFEDYSDE